MELRLVAAVVAVSAYVAWCVAVFRTQRRQRAQAARDMARLASTASSTTPWLIAFASQTGVAEQLAHQTAQGLHDAGVPTRVVELGRITADDLTRNERALFIASTYGEGDPPDNAGSFASRVMAGSALALPRLHVAVLALGDREYQHFCGFGRALDAWLMQCGARPLFDRIDVDNAVDNADDAALRRWRQNVGRVAGTSDLPDGQEAPAFERWRLVMRRHLNPGSIGAPTFHLALTPSDAATLPPWQSGDLVQVLAPGDAKRPREYSIASLPADGSLHLLVRQERHADGSLGMASGWLTAEASLNEEVALRLRPHRGFQLGDNALRPLILIGNGTGLAGLRSHLKARAANGVGRNWLVFGERQAAFDFYHRGEIEAWQANGVLERADLVFSRDQPERRHVQDRLREVSEDVRHWLANGAAVYVCGSLNGMAGGVDAALTEIAGIDGVRALSDAGRYRRDVY